MICWPQNNQFTIHDIIYCISEAYDIIVGFVSIEIAISTNQHPTIYRNLTRIRAQWFSSVFHIDSHLAILYSKFTSDAIDVALHNNTVLQKCNKTHPKWQSKNVDRSVLIASLNHHRMTA